MSELEQGVDDYLDACYAEWLMAQPEAGIFNGDTLVQRMEQGWGWEQFVAHFTGRTNG